MTEASLSTLSTTLDNAIANALSPKIEKPLVAETVNDSQDTVLASLSLEEVAKLPEIVPLSEEEALANPMKVDFYQ